MTGRSARGAQLPVKAVAARIATATGRPFDPRTWRAYVSRGSAPKADGHWPCGCPWWWESTVDGYLAERHGAPGRPRKVRT